MTIEEKLICANRISVSKEILIVLKNENKYKAHFVNPNFENGNVTFLHEDGWKLFEVAGKQEEKSKIEIKSIQTNIIARNKTILSITDIKDVILPPFPKILN